ncbi:phage major capsid protein [Mycolicibacterium mageritense]|uniref:phage major capsid protein n=1 Tax=Mycolicibacterium mageritense TaxID=53462 RepID=UPI001E5017CF|nr:phage major capsid protein [Mycolicibacterium mageritense]GJJ22289.1 hypothetical protein MTY414_59620 [Mycolicibacterium mageritense]
MTGSNINSGDDMIRRLENELREKQTFANEIISRAQAGSRDLTDEDKNLLSETRGRIEAIKDQLDTIEDLSRVSFESSNRAKQVGAAIDQMKGRHDAGPIEYRSAGAYALDSYKSHLGDREATERLEMFHRAAAHQKTTDNLGVIPDPVIGEVLNFIDGSRPIVGFLGPRPLPGATWHRPKVTAHTTVGKQGTNGAAADEKSELVSQKMTITRLDASAVTYGGYVNVSRQNIDFSNPSAFDAIVNDLSVQYAIQTESAAGAALLATTNEVELATASAGTPSADELVGGLWSAVAAVYNATKGAGSLVLVVDPSKLPVWGKAFSSYTMNQDGRASGMSITSAFGQGFVGNIQGVPVLVSAGLGGASTDYGVLLSSAAIEVYEERIGTLQVTEPSVLGVQVAYAGYFTPMVVESGGIQRIVNEA